MVQAVGDGSIVFAGFVGQEKVVKVKKINLGFVSFNGLDDRTIYLEKS